MRERIRRSLKMLTMMKGMMHMKMMNMTRRRNLITIWMKANLLTTAMGRRSMLPKMREITKAILTAKVRT